MSRIIYKKLDANHKLIFRKFEKEIKVRLKIYKKNYGYILPIVCNRILNKILIYVFFKLIY